MDLEAFLRRHLELNGHGLELPAVCSVRHEVYAVAPPRLGHFPTLGEEQAFEDGPPFKLGDLGVGPHLQFWIDREKRRLVA